MAKRKTIAFVPGSFRPPTAWHWDMISHYASVADYVVVLVSSPRKAVRGFADPGIDMTAEKSKAILDAFKERFGKDNVVIRVSEDPSPVKDVLKALSGLTKAVVIIGTSDKGGDAGRYGWIADEFAGREDIRVLDPAETAYRADPGLSASDVRAGMGDFSAYERALPAGLSPSDVLRIKGIVYA